MEKQKGKIDYFGFLLRKWSFDFDNIRISILENYDEIKAYIEKHKNRDEFLYPPMSRRRLFDPFKNEWGEVIPNTERTALLFHINASHSIFIDSSTSIEEDRIELVDKILEKKKDNPEADTSNLEREIDKLVYKLYELTPEEIKIIE